MGGKPASLAYLRDFTARKEMEEKLRTMSIVDELTGLYNRRGFITLSHKQLKRNLSSRHQTDAVDLTPVSKSRDIRKDNSSE